jgi:two-component system nitrogen regulation response regulator NtrX
MKQRILVIDDDAAIRDSIRMILEYEGYDCLLSPTAQEGLAAIEKQTPDIVFLDIKMPGMDGLEALAKIKQIDGALPVVMISGHGTTSTVVEAMKAGAVDFIDKPVARERLLVTIKNELEREQLRDENKSLRRALDARHQMVGESGLLREVGDAIKRAAPTNATVLILGESGVGKELVARAIHRSSLRSRERFIQVNCAAIPEELIESELFGHEKGSFTGAVDRRAGCFELADHGTLFLDEIAEMTPSTQVKLLRVLQERKFRRLGGRSEETVDVRVIAATNANPGDAVRSGKLREDLYYRLNVFAIELPPLRQRKEDLALLVQSFLADFNARNNKQVSALDPSAMRILEQYNWPGNVRELRNVIERAVILSSGEFIDQKQLPPLVTESPDVVKPTLSLTPGTTVEEAETRLILMTLEHTRDNKTRAAEILGISLKTLHNKLNKLRGRGKRSEEESVIP